MGEEIRITLPDAETMMTRLKEIDDVDHIVQGLYSRLIRDAGRERVPMGIVMMLQLAIHNYTEGMPQMMVAVLNVNMERYIDALVLDETAALNAKAHWAKIQEMARAR